MTEAPVKSMIFSWAQDIVGIDLRHGTAAHQSHQRTEQSSSRTGDGVQAVGGSLGALTLRQRSILGRACRGRRDIREGSADGGAGASRHRGRRVIIQDTSSTIFDDCSA